MTFLMVFLIQNSQNRDAKAVQIKLDELIRLIGSARNQIIDVEDSSEQELENLTLGGVAIADPRHVAEVTTIERPPNGVEEVPVILSRLLEAHELILRKVRQGITKTATNRGDGTNDLLMSEVLRTHELQVWLLAEYLVDTPLVCS